VEALAGFTEIAADAGGPGGPGGSRRGPISNATRGRRVSVRMTVDAHCRYLLDVSVVADPPLR
jgi:hypothetical protein